MNKRFLSVIVRAAQIFGAVILAGWFGAVAAGEITPKMQIKIDAYKKQAASWAANPAIVKAVKDANAQGPIPMMGNAKWRELKETDPVVSGFISNPTGQLLTKWMHAGDLYRQGQAELRRGV